ncbi:MAG: ATP-binding cassette domain-containing protein [Bacteroidota bacterium]
MSLLEADSINLSFENRPILSNVYLSCSTGDIVGVIGRNGSGKSSLMKIIFGTLIGENQSIRVDKSYVAHLYKRINAITYLPQEGLLMNYLTITQLSRIFNTPELLEVENFKNYQNDRLGELSGGLKKLVEILTLLYTDSMFTILDEPFSFLSPILVEEVIQHIQQQRSKKGIILTDHQYQAAWSVTTKRYVLVDGVIKEISDLKELELYGYLLSSKN